MNSVDTLVIKKPLTYDISNTQSYDKVDECKTLEYSNKSCILKHTKKITTIITK